MLVIAGYLVIIVCVFGGFIMSGGSMYALFQPFEFLIIFGAALGAFIVGNNPKVIKASIRAVLSTLKGVSYSKKFYIELLSLFFELTNKIRKEGVLSIEGDIEKPKESELFKKYPLIAREDRIMEFFCDHLRLIITGRVDAMHLEMLMDEDIETFQSEKELPINAISKVADSLPAFGIVAAVMGVVITMQLISEPPEVLGAHVAKALVGTFLGVLLGYGFTAPLAAILENRLHAEIMILQSIKVVLLASVHNMAPTIAVEFARKVLYSAERPTSSELEKILRDVKSGKSSGEDGAAAVENTTENQSS
jgi:chemotaxis protein MotA